MFEELSITTKVNHYAKWPTVSREPGPQRGQAHDYVILVLRNLFRSLLKWTMKVENGQEMEVS